MIWPFNIFNKKKECNYRKSSIGRPEQLETRKMMAVDSVEVSGDALVIRCDDTNSHVVVNSWGNYYVVNEPGIGRSSGWYHAPSLKEIRFHGGSGNDSFSTSARHLKVLAWGNAGDDQLTGSTLRDVLFGGPGNDSLFGLSGNDVMRGGHGDDDMYGWSGNDDMRGDAGKDRMYGGPDRDIMRGGSGDDYLKGGSARDILFGGFGRDHLIGDAGNDILLGEDGDDVLLGGADNDWIDGGNGDDHLNGQSGWDRMFGQDGDDILIAIDNYGDARVDGGPGRDAYWTDYREVDRGFWARGGREWRDVIRGVESHDTVHEITRFDNRADLTLDHDNISDPTWNAPRSSSRRDLRYMSFPENPLFAEGGPSSADIQIAHSPSNLRHMLGNADFLLELGAIASESPTTIRHNVVDFNDGTFGVHIHDRFYRVDSQLPVWRRGTRAPDQLAFTGTGLDGSLWMAVVEKAVAHHEGGYHKVLEETNMHDMFHAFGFYGRHTQIGEFRNWYRLSDELHRSEATVIELGEWTGINTALAIDTPRPPSHVLNQTYIVERIVHSRFARGVYLRKPLNLRLWTGSTGTPGDDLIFLSFEQLYLCNGLVRTAR